MAVTKEQLDQLAAFFPARSISWKPQSTKAGRALAVAYIDARDVMRRLDTVCGGDWSFAWEPVGQAVKGTLSIAGTIREDAGEEGDGPAGESIKAAVSDALKRCAVHFGVGRYLYYLPAQWVGWDEANKRFTDEPKLPEWALPEDEKPKKPVNGNGHDKANCNIPSAWQGWATEYANEMGLTTEQIDKAVRDGGKYDWPLPTREPAQRTIMVNQLAAKITRWVEAQAHAEEKAPKHTGESATAEWLAQHEQDQAEQDEAARAPAQKPAKAMTEAEKRGLTAFQRALNANLATLVQKYAVNLDIDSLRHLCLQAVAGVEHTEQVPQADYGKVLAGLDAAVAHLMEEAQTAKAGSTH